MGIHVTFYPITRIIQIDKVPSLVNGEYINELDFTVDVYSDGKEDYKTESEFSKVKFPIRVVGGDPTVGSESLGASFFLDSTWKIRPYESNHRNILEGNIYSEDGRSIWSHTIGAYNVSNEIKFTNLINIVTSDQSSLLQQGDIDNIVDAFFDEILSGSHEITGSAGKIMLDNSTSLTAVSSSISAIQGAISQIQSDVATVTLMVTRLLGLNHENHLSDNYVFDNTRLQSCRIRIYSSADSVGTENDVIATYTVTATWDGTELLTHKVVKV